MTGEDPEDAEGRPDADGCPVATGSPRRRSCASGSIVCGAALEAPERIRSIALSTGIRVHLESSAIVGSRPSSPASARRADAIWFKCCSSSIGTACRAKGSRSSKPETRGPKARHEDGRRPDLSVRHDESSPT